MSYYCYEIVLCLKRWMCYIKVVVLCSYYSIVRFIDVMVLWSVLCWIGFVKNMLMLFLRVFICVFFEDKFVSVSIGIVVRCLLCLWVWICCVVLSLFMMGMEIFIRIFEN